MILNEFLLIIYLGDGESRFIFRGKVVYFLLGGWGGGGDEILNYSFLILILDGGKIIIV